MHVRFVVNILGTKNCTQSALKPHNKSPETRINAEFPSSIFLFELANKILSLYFLVLVLWFYFVLYVFNCRESIDCTERCYQFVIIDLLSFPKSLIKSPKLSYPLSLINCFIFLE